MDESATKPNIVAHSHEGAVALMLAAVHPRRVRRLIPLLYDSGNDIAGGFSVSASIRTAGLTE